MIFHTDQKRKALSPRQWQQRQPNTQTNFIPNQKTTQIDRQAAKVKPREKKGSENLTALVLENFQKTRADTSLLKG